jgi:hypothetical protein
MKIKEDGEVFYIIPQILITKDLRSSEL